MGSTPNFGFKTMRAGESFDEDGYQYTYADRLRMDSIFKQMLEHDHTAAAASLEEPDSPPTLDLEVSGGYHGAGRRIYYKYSYVDSSGNESLASDPTYVDTPVAVEPPAAPAISYASTGGSLPPGVYQYVLTAYTSATTTETLIGKIAYLTINVSTSTNEVTLTMPSVPSGATGFNIYRKGPGNPRFYFLASTTSASYDDDGSVALTSTRTTPVRNTTSSTNKVEISLPMATPTVPDGHTWKIYRTFDLADWSNSLLKWVVEETSEGSGIIDPTYEDVGGSTSFGSPLDSSFVVSSPSKIDMDDAAEISGSPPPGLLTIPHQIQFGQSGTVEQGEGVLVWTCEFDNAEIVDVRASLGVDSVASDNIIFDVNKYDSDAATPGWTTIFSDPSDRPEILASEWRMASPTQPTSTTRLVKGDALAVDVDVSNEADAATVTGEGFTITILMMVKHGSTTTSWDWS